jgi:hypothetical protein
MQNYAARCKFRPVSGGGAASLVRLAASFSICQSGVPKSKKKKQSDETERLICSGANNGEQRGRPPPHAQIEREIHIAHKHKRRAKNGLRAALNISSPAK